MDINSFNLVHYASVVVVFVFFFYAVPYLYDPYEYRRRFSGPPLAGFTNWWMFYLIRTGHHSELVQQLHEKYGTFVRLGPNHISIADPEALEVVYGHAFLKSEFYHIFQNGSKKDLFNTLDKAEHSKKRKRLAPIFSPQNSLTFEPRVRRHIRELCAQWDLRCSEAARGVSGVNWEARKGQAVIDICDQFSYLAFDIIGDLALGSPFGLIQAQKDSSLAIESIDANGEPQRGTVEIPIVKTIVNGGIVAMSVGVFPSWAHRISHLLPWNISGFYDRLNFFKLTIASVDAKLKRGQRDDIVDGKRSIDLLDKLLEVRDEDGNSLSIDELYAEAFLLLVAGSDTTSNTLGSLYYHLAMHPEIQRQLQAELDQHVPYDPSLEAGNKEGLTAPSYDAIAQYDDIKNLPYLNACIKEALRIHAPVATGLPRVVPPGKMITIAGQTFKAGSVISVPSYTTNRSSVWGNDAAEFRPERWLNDESHSLNKYFVPFSVGPRACVGRNLAQIELTLVVATLVRRYEIEALPTTQLITREGFLHGTIHCDVMIKRRGT
ncbi:Benzoate 4-monooxygenase [Rhizoctonia solani]|uniref:Benzoate 4-monooxygenase n=1 Tax=Rhizoctonia solani TaxID=456999 RepID=A0A0K6FUI1_9AGAM|nr:Benzoate 4-monooxygenase [Rhizoctonia solani]